MGIYELMGMTSQIRDMTFKGEPTQNLRKMARKQGMHTLFEDGMIKALKGQTTLDEVMRITNRDIASEPVQVSGRARPSIASLRPSGCRGRRWQSRVRLETVQVGGRASPGRNVT